MKKILVNRFAMAIVALNRIDELRKIFETMKNLNKLKLNNRFNNIIKEVKKC